MKRKKSSTPTPRPSQVRIEFTDRPITSWGGLAALAGRFLERVGFRGWVEAHVPVTERSNNARGIYEKVLATFLTVLSGGVRFSHLGWWSHGVEALQRAFGVAWLPKAASTLTRFWNKIDRAGLSERLLEGGRQLAARLVAWEGLTEDNLNLDSTVLIRYGEQEGARKGYNPAKHGRPSHHPLLAFLGAGYVVNFWNRSGNTRSGNGVAGFFTQTLEALGAGFKVRRVLADSGFYLLEFLELLEQKGLAYIITAAVCRPLQRRVREIEQWIQVEEGIEAAEFEFQHAEPKWKRPRRYVAVRQEVARRPKAMGKQLSLFQEFEELRGWRYSVLVTNDRETPPVEIWRAYRPRANDENVIKDLKEGYGLEAFNMKNFWATEALLGMIALVFHNLVHCLNRHAVSQKGPQAQLRTLRLGYFVIPGQLGSSGRHPILRLGVRREKGRARIESILQRISLISLDLKCNALSPAPPGGPPAEAPQEMTMN